MEIGAYKSTGLLRESLRSIIHQGVRRSDGREVVIKVPAAHLLTAEVRPRFRNEWLIGRMFDAPELAQVLEFVDAPEQVALVFAKDGPLVALDQLTPPKALSVRDCLRVALGVLDALTLLHAKNVIHKDVKPSNVLVSASFDRVVLIDFGISTVLPRDLGPTRAEPRFEGTLGFMPPEQTGRINRTIDYRSDYYGLGATLYSLLTGERPFADIRDHSALVHAQLTRVPPLVNERRPELPEVLGRIVEKLLRKSADERYQGSFGLRRDLQRCLDALCASPEHAPLDFEIAALDPSERLRPAQRLHGREPQREALLTAQRRSQLGPPSLVRVSGPSGSGKSTLVAELRASLEPRHVTFADCKFDQYSQPSPLTGVGRILGRFLAQTLLHPSISPELLRRRIGEALGPNAALLQAIVPALDALLEIDRAGPRAVGPAEARDRFWDTVERFVLVLRQSTPEQVLFIDDVQWADATSLRLLELLCAPGSPAQPSAGAASLGAMTLILGCRFDEIDAEHPLERMLRPFVVEPGAAGDAGASPRSPVELEEVIVGPLELEAVVSLVDEVLGGVPNGHALAELIHQRTGGTPLYATQLLMALYAEGIIDIDRSRGQWRIDIARARARGSSGDVVEFLVDQFERLPPPVQRVLGIAACIGARFPIEALAAATEMTVTEVSVIVWDAVSAGHLLPLSPQARPLLSVPIQDTIASTSMHYGFVHDRIQQIARHTLAEDRRELYLGLARRSILDASAQGEDVHALARYIGEAIARVQDPSEAARFAMACMAAGAQARSAAIFGAAAEHLGHARVLLARADAPRPQRFSLGLELAECFAMAGERSQAAAAFDEAKALIDEPTQRARMMLSQVTLAMVVGDTERALTVLLSAAEPFQLDLRLGGDQAWVGALMTAVLARVHSHGAGVPTLPELRAPLQLALGQMLLAATNAAYLAGDINLYTALALTMIDLGLTHGVCDVTGVAFVQLAIVFASGLSDYEGARRFGAVGFAILERFPDSPLWGMANVIRGTTIQPWTEHMPSSVPLLEAAHLRLRASGMIVNAGYAHFSIVMNSFTMGAPLPTVIERCERALSYLDKFGDRPLASSTRVHIAACERLRAGPLPERPPLSGKNGNDDKDDKDGQAASLNPAAFFLVHSVRAFTAWLLDERLELEEAIASVGPALAAGTGLFPWIVFKIVVTLHGCTQYGAHAENHGRERAELQSEIEAMIATLARWRESCPENAEPFVHLLGGAWAEARGELDAARVAYTRAADSAADSGFLPFEGVANERGAELLLLLDDRRGALGYLACARLAYRRWGAQALERRVARRQRSLGHGDPRGELDAPATDPLYTLDVSSLVRMSMALSETTRVRDILAQLLDLAAENAGADRSAVLIRSEGELALSAFQLAGERMHAVEPAIAMEELEGQLARQLVRECARTSQPITIDDTLRAAEVNDSPLLAGDPYLASGEARSILCLPMLERGEVIGVLYLENRVTPGAFTHQHLRVLGTLTAQAAIGIANVRLLDDALAREARWRSLATSAPDSILIADRSRRIQYANRPAFGRSIAELVGAPVDELVAPDERERVAAAIDDVLSRGENSAYEASVLTPDGPRQFTTRLGPILGEAGVEQVTLISTDVTEQRQLEQQFRQSQKMQAVGTLAGGVAHDFNNLLTVILGTCELGELELAESGLADELPRALAESFTEIGAAARRASELTRQLLAFSRRQVLQPKHIDLNGLVDGVSRMLTRLIGADIDLVLDLAEHPCGVHADPGQFEQVIVNLVVNARDAMPRGGTLTLGTRRELILPGQPRLRASSSMSATFPEGRAVILEVRDTGEGMDDETKTRIFEPFFTTKASGKGTGLGLSTVLGIAEQSGGAVAVDSRLGEGSTFTVVLPADDGETHTELGAEPLSPPLQGSERVLLVEDDPAVRRLTALLLDGHGYEVHTADGGDQAQLRAAELESIDMLITDIVMPGLSGLEVAQAVLAVHPGAKLLFISGYTNDTVVRHGIHEGDAAFLQKPFTRTTLLQTVRDILDAPPLPRAPLPGSSDEPSP